MSAADAVTVHVGGMTEANVIIIIIIIVHRSQMLEDWQRLITLLAEPQQRVCGPHQLPLL